MWILWNSILFPQMKHNIFYFYRWLEKLEQSVPITLHSKRMHSPAAQHTLVLICDLKQQTHMQSSEIVDADELNSSIVSTKSTWQNQGTFAETISFDTLRHRSYYYPCVIERQKLYMQKYMPFSSPFYKENSRARPASWNLFSLIVVFKTYNRLSDLELLDFDETWAWVLALSPTSYVTTGKLFKLFTISFSYL